MAKKKTVAPKLPRELNFDYIKSNQFRVITMDGAFGGLSPNSKTIHMAIFNERRPIPKKTIHSVSPTGVVGPEVERVAREGFIREIEVDVVLDLETAQRLSTWLLDKISQMTAIQEKRRVAAIANKSNGSSKDGK